MAEAKTTTTVKLPKDVFNVEVANHELLQRAYQAYLANGRDNYAQVKTRGLVRGGGRKPWRQKGTGRARFGSSRNPIWRGGGIVFGPTGHENYRKALPTQQKRQAIRQALTVAHTAKKVTVIDGFTCPDGKVKHTLELLKKHQLNRNVLLVVDYKDELVDRATRNVAAIKATHASYLNVFDILNADRILITEASLTILESWLAPSKSAATRKQGAQA